MATATWSAFFFTQYAGVFTGRTWKNLAVARLDLGQLGKAIRCWKRARAAYAAADDTAGVDHIDQLLQTVRLHLNMTTRLIASLHL
ncbi:hypothetical protein ACFVYA_35190 [Amycolatopsis sp. NPDC058278]|uniref:hypothetical protein n=1 Tax=Amycolatopsis sp. NPDC058278 TaxID=3346417 RepID=UPI0036DB40F5